MYGTGDFDEPGGQILSMGDARDNNVGDYDAATLHSDHVGRRDHPADVFFEDARSCSSTWCLSGRAGRFEAGGA